MDATFKANGKTWKTDAATLALLDQYREAGNDEMLGLVFEIGKHYGRIVEA